MIDKVRPSSFKMVVDGGGRGGSVRGDGLLRLSYHEGETEIEITGDAQVTRVIARVGQRLLGSIAQILLNQFFNCMKARVEPD